MPSDPTHDVEEFLQQNSTSVVLVISNWNDRTMQVNIRTNSTANETLVLFKL